MRKANDALEDPKKELYYHLSRTMYNILERVRSTEHKAQVQMWVETPHLIAFANITLLGLWRDTLDFGTMRIPNATMLLGHLQPGGHGAEDQSPKNWLPSYERIWTEWFSRKLQDILLLAISCNCDCYSRGIRRIKQLNFPSSGYLLEQSFWLPVFGAMPPLSKIMPFSYWILISLSGSIT